MDLLKAKAIAAEFLREKVKSLGEGAVIADKLTVVTPYGWIFFWGSARYVRTGDPRDQFCGGEPVLVFRTGEIHYLLRTHSRFRSRLRAFERERGLPLSFELLPPDPSLTRSQARELAEAYASSRTIPREGGAILLDERTIEKSYGWIFSWTTDSMTKSLASDPRFIAGEFNSQVAVLRSREVFDVGFFINREMSVTAFEREFELPAD